MGRHQQFLKFVAIFVIMCLLAQDVAMALPSTQPEGRRPEAKGGSFSELRVPGSGLKIHSNLGNVDESFEGTNGKHITFILDAHDSLDAQKNIVRIIQQATNSGIKTVFEEGYEGELNTDDWFGAIEDDQILRKVSYYYLDQLKIGAAEFAHINRHRRLGRRPEATDQSSNASQSSRLRAPGPRVDWKLIGADDKEAYLENVRAFGDSEKVREQILRDTQAIQRELKVLGDKQLSPEAKKWILDYERFHDNSLPLLDYLGRWIKLAPENACPLLRRIVAAAQDPEIARSIQKTRASEVLSEIKTFEAAVEKHFFPNNQTAEIWQAWKTMAAVEKLAELKISNQDLSHLKNNLKALKTENLARQFARAKKNPVVISKRWEMLIQNALRFYELAHKRDEAVERTLKEWVRRPETGDPIKKTNLAPQASGLGPSKNSSAVLVFGGFHREGITEILRRNGFSYTVVIPKIIDFSKRHQALYREAMSVGPRGSGFRPQASVQAARPLSNFYDPAFGSEIRAAEETIKENPGRDLSASALLLHEKLSTTAAHGIAGGNLSRPSGSPNTRRLLNSEKLPGLRAASPGVGTVMPHARSESRAKKTVEQLVDEAEKLIRDETSIRGWWKENIQNANQNQAGKGSRSTNFSIAFGEIIPRPLREAKQLLERLNERFLAEQTEAYPTNAMNKLFFIFCGTYVSQKKNLWNKAFKQLPEDSQKIFNSAAKQHDGLKTLSNLSMYRDSVFKAMAEERDFKRADVLEAIKARQKFEHEIDALIWFSRVMKTPEAGKADPLDTFYRNYSKPLARDATATVYHELVRQVPREQITPEFRNAMTAYHDHLVEYRDAFIFILSEIDKHMPFRSESRQNKKANNAIPKEEEQKARQLQSRLEAYLPQLEKWSGEKKLSVRSAQAQNKAAVEMAALLNTYVADYVSKNKPNESVNVFRDSLGKSLQIWDIETHVFVGGDKDKNLPGDIRGDLVRVRDFIKTMRVHLDADRWQTLSDYYDGNRLHLEKIAGRSEAREPEKLSIRSIFHPKHFWYSTGLFAFFKIADSLFLKWRTLTIGEPDYWKPLDWITSVTYPLSIANIGFYFLFLWRSSSWNEAVTQKVAHIILTGVPTLFFVLEFVGPYIFPSGMTGHIFDPDDAAAVLLSGVILRLLHSTKLPPAKRSEARDLAAPDKEAVQRVFDKVTEGNPLSAEDLEIAVRQAVAESRAWLIGRVKNAMSADELKKIQEEAAAKKTDENEIILSGKNCAGQCGYSSADVMNRLYSILGDKALIRRIQAHDEFGVKQRQKHLFVLAALPDQSKSFLIDLTFTQFLNSGWLPLDLIGRELKNRDGKREAQGLSSLLLHGYVDLNRNKDFLTDYAYSFISGSEDDDAHYPAQFLPADLITLAPNAISRPLSDFLTLDVNSEAAFETALQERELNFDLLAQERRERLKEMFLKYAARSEVRGLSQAEAEKISKLHAIYMDVMRNKSGAWKDGAEKVESAGFLVTGVGYYPIDTDNELEHLLAIFPKIRDKTNSSQPLRFLDLGSGAGKLLVQALMLDSNLNGVGIEYDQVLHEASLDLAEEAAKQKLISRERARFLKGDFSAPEFEKEISSADVLFHYQASSFDPAPLEQALIRSMRPGTKLLVYGSSRDYFRRLSADLGFERVFDEAARVITYKRNFMPREPISYQDTAVVFVHTAGMGDHSLPLALDNRRVIKDAVKAMQNLGGKELEFHIDGHPSYLPPRPDRIRSRQKNTAALTSPFSYDFDPVRKAQRFVMAGGECEACFQAALTSLLEEGNEEATPKEIHLAADAVYQVVPVLNEDDPRGVHNESAPVSAEHLLKMVEQTAALKQLRNSSEVTRPQYFLNGSPASSKTKIIIWSNHREMIDWIRTDQKRSEAREAAAIPVRPANLTVKKFDRAPAALKHWVTKAEEEPWGVLEENSPPFVLQDGVLTLALGEDNAKYFFRPFPERTLGLETVQINESWTEEGQIRFTVVKKLPGNRLIVKGFVVSNESEEVSISAKTKIRVRKILELKENIAGRVAGGTVYPQSVIAAETPKRKILPTFLPVEKVVVPTVEIAQVANIPENSPVKMVARKKLAVIAALPADFDWEKLSAQLPAFEKNELLGETTERGYFNLRVGEKMVYVMTNLGVKDKREVFVRSAEVIGKGYRLVLGFSGTDQTTTLWMGHFRTRAFDQAANSKTGTEIFEILDEETWTEKFFAELLLKPDEKSWEEILKPFGNEIAMNLGKVYQNGFRKVKLGDDLWAEISVAPHKYAGYSIQVVSVRPEDDLLRVELFLTSPDGLTNVTLIRYVSSEKEKAQSKGAALGKEVFYRRLLTEADSIDLRAGKEIARKTKREENAAIFQALPADFIATLSPLEQKVVAQLAQNPEISNQEIAKALNSSKPSVSNAIQRIRFKAKVRNLIPKLEEKIGRSEARILDYEKVSDMELTDSVRQAWFAKYKLGMVEHALEIIDFSGNTRDARKDVGTQAYGFSLPGDSKGVFVAFPFAQMEGERDNGYFALFDQQGEMVGEGLYSAAVISDSKRKILTLRFQVLPEYRSQGYGRVMTEAIRYFADQLDSEMQLFFHFNSDEVNNLALRKSLTGLGFQEIPQVSHMMQLPRLASSRSEARGTDSQDLDRLAYLWGQYTEALKENPVQRSHAGTAFSRWLMTQSALDLGAGAYSFVDTLKNLGNPNTYRMDTKPVRHSDWGTYATHLQQSFYNPWPLGDESLKIIYSHWALGGEVPGLYPSAWDMPLEKNPDATFANELKRTLHPDGFAYFELGFEPNPDLVRALRRAGLHVQSPPEHAEDFGEQSLAVIVTKKPFADVINQIQAELEANNPRLAENVNQEVRGMRSEARPTENFKPQVIQHRANTRDFIEAAYEAGADGFEMDIQMTKDGVMILNHDPFQIGNAAHFSVELNYSELKAANPELLTLKDALNLPVLRQKTAYLHVNNLATMPSVREKLKQKGKEALLDNYDVRAVSAIQKEIQNSAGLSRLVFSSFDVKQLLLLRKEAVSARFILDTDYGANDPEINQVLDLAAEYKLTGVGLPGERITVDLLQDVNARGLQADYGASPEILRALMPLKTGNLVVVDDVAATRKILTSEEEEKAHSKMRAVRLNGELRPTQSSFLERHDPQWKILREQYLDGILQRAKQDAGDSKNPVIKVLVLGSSSGEELVRAYYEIVTYLESRGEKLARTAADEGWKLQITGIEKDDVVAERARKNLQGETPFFAYDLDVEPNRTYIEALLQRVSRDSDLVAEAIEVRTQNAVEALKETDSAHLILANNVFYLLGSVYPREDRAAIELLSRRFRNSVIATTYDWNTQIYALGGKPGEKELPFVRAESKTLAKYIPDETAYLFFSPNPDFNLVASLRSEARGFFTKAWNLASSRDARLKVAQNWLEKGLVDLEERKEITKDEAQKLLSAARENRDVGVLLEILGIHLILKVTPHPGAFGTTAAMTGLATGQWWLVPLYFLTGIFRGIATFALIRKTKLPHKWFLILGSVIPVAGNFSVPAYMLRQPELRQTGKAMMAVAKLRLKQKARIIPSHDKRSEMREFKAEWNEEALTQIEKANPGTRAKILQVLEIPLSQLVLDQDYDDQDGRSVLIYLDEPVDFVDKQTGLRETIRTIKVKGAAFENEAVLPDFNLLRLDPGVAPDQAENIGRKLMEPSFTKEGRFLLTPKRPTAEGAMRLDMARQEYQISQKSFYAGLPVPIALGMAEFQNKNSDGTSAAAVILGVASARDLRVTNLIGFKTQAYLQSIAQPMDSAERAALKAFFEEDVVRLAGAQGQALRAFNDRGFIHPQFHLGNGGANIDLDEGLASIYLMDHEGSLERNKLTEAQFLGWLVLGLKQAAKRIHDLTDKRYYSGPKLNWTSAFIRGYFGRYADRPEIKKYLSPKNSALFIEDLHAILFDAEKQPVFEINSPLTRLLAQMYGLKELRRSEARNALEIFDEAADNLLAYPKALLHSRGLEPYLDAFDREHYVWDEAQQHWASKDFHPTITGAKRLTLGSWEDIQRASPDEHARMKNFVAIRLNTTEGVRSFYAFDDHGWSLQAYAEAHWRREVPAFGNTQIFIDKHGDDRKVHGGQHYKEMFQAMLRQSPSANNDIDFDMGGFNNTLWFSGFIPKENHHRYHANMGWFREMLAGFPSNQAVLLNVDTDATEFIVGEWKNETPLGLGEDDFESLAIDLTNLRDKYSLTPLTAHFTTTHFENENLADFSLHSNRIQYGDTELARFLPRVAPFIYFVKDQPVELRDQAIEQAAQEHAAQWERDFGAKFNRSEMRKHEISAELFFVRSFQEKWARRTFIEQHWLLRAIARGLELSSQDAAFWVLEWDFAKFAVLNRLAQNLKRFKGLKQEDLARGMSFETLIFDVMEDIRDPEYRFVRKFLGWEEPPADFFRMADEAVSRVSDYVKLLEPDQARYGAWVIRNAALDYQSYFDYLVNVIGRDDFFEFDSEVEKIEQKFILSRRSEMRADWNDEIGLWSSPQVIERLSQFVLDPLSVSLWRLKASAWRIPESDVNSVRDEVLRRSKEWPRAAIFQREDFSALSFLHLPWSYLKARSALMDDPDRFAVYSLWEELESLSKKIRESRIYTYETIRTAARYSGIWGHGTASSVLREARSDYERWRFRAVHDHDLEDEWAMLNIMIEGEISAGEGAPFAGMELSGNTPDSWGPFWILTRGFESFYQFHPSGREDHWAYLVPNQAAIDFFERGLELAVSKKLMTEEDRQDVCSKLVTYDEFNALEELLWNIRDQKISISEAVAQAGVTRSVRSESRASSNDTVDEVQLAKNEERYAQIMKTALKRVKPGQTGELVEIDSGLSAEEDAQFDQELKQLSVYFAEAGDSAKAAVMFWLIKSDEMAADLAKDVISLKGLGEDRQVMIRTTSPPSALLRAGELRTTNSHSQAVSGTKSRILISRTELGSMSEENFKAFYKFFYQNQELELSVYGSGSKNPEEETRVGLLEAVPSAKTGRVSFFLDPSSAAQGGEAIEFSSVPGTKTLRGKKIAAADIRTVEGMASGFLAAMGMEYTEDKGFVRVTSGIEISRFFEFLSWQVFAASA